MPRISEQAKQRGLERVFLTVKRYAPRGATEVEIASYTGIHRRTVNNYLNELGEEGKVFKDGLVWLPTDFEETRLLSFEVTAAEGYTLAIGGRLLVKQLDKRNELAESALIKLADKLVSETNIGQEIAQAAQELAQRPVRPGYQPIFQTMVEAYLKRQRVEIIYKPLGYSKGFTTTFETYLIEPSAIGFSTYVIGRSSIVSDLRAYKLERIQSAEPLRNNRYRIPDDFPGLQILRNSWSIIMGDETVRVVLRFSPEVRERVRETQWHPSQADEEDKEKKGWLRWWVDVADTMDMVPWIRGWGSQVEVLEPKELRNKLKRESLRMAQIYGGLETKVMEPYWKLWAKTNRPKNTKYHLLVYHLVDVGNVALAMWKEVFTLGFKEQLATALNLSVKSTGNLVAFLAAIHDLGKACPDFQGYESFATSFPDQRRAIEMAGFQFPVKHTPCKHGFVSTWALRNLLLRYMTDDLAMKVAIVIGGHHGQWPISTELDQQSSHAGHSEWDLARKQLFDEIANLFAPPPTISDTIELRQETENMLLVTLAGITSVTDWIGSMAGFFTYQQQPLELNEYAEESAEKAHLALQRLGWTNWQPPTETMSFAKQFNFDELHPAQKIVVDLAEEWKSPTLVIVEDATGNGKTEMGLYLGDHWARVLGNRGVYIAMPTMATSNQMHERVTNVLKRRYPQSNLEPILIHSQARFTEKTDEIALDIQSINDESTRTNSELKYNEIDALAWFEDKRKRSLLAPFGVGTVDQTFLGVLQTRHFFVRLFALAHKTIIFDEVHAYDTYMTTLFQTLIRWLHALGSSVVVLSATLPVATRQALVKAYGGDPIRANDRQSSGLITWVTKTGSETVTDQKQLPTFSDN